MKIIIDTRVTGFDCLESLDEPSDLAQCMLLAADSGAVVELSGPEMLALAEEVWDASYQPEEPEEPEEPEAEEPTTWLN